MIFIETTAETEKLSKFLKWVGKKTVLGVDTETTGLDCHSSKVLLFQIGDEYEQWVFDCQKFTDEKMIKLLNHLNSLPFKKVLHNAKFDFNMIRSNYNIELNNIYCTYITSQVIRGGDRAFGGSLDKILFNWLDVKEIDKKIRQDFSKHTIGGTFTDELINYAANDVKYLPKLYYKLEAKTRDLGLTNIIKLENNCVLATADIEYNGISIDETKWLKLETRAKLEANKVRVELEKYFEDKYSRNLFGELSLNFNSPAQMKPALEAVIGYKLDSTDAAYLETIDHDVVKKLIEYRKWSKLTTTYGSEFIKKNINPVTKKLHSSFNQMGAETGRYSSSEPNLQNIPKEQAFRDPFCASSDDYRIISADFSGQELRLLAHLSQEPQFIKALKEKKDLHAYSASLLYEIPYEDFFVFNEDGTLQKNTSIADSEGFNKEMKKKYRNPAKSITFGLLYGMGPSKLANSLKITIDEAKQLLNKYFKVFPDIKVLMDSLETRARETKVAYSPLDGRLRQLNADWLRGEGPTVARAINKAKNMPFQGCGASTTKLAMCYIRKEFKDKNYDAKLVLTVHDEILVECHKDIVEECKDIVVNNMKKAFNYYAPSVEMDISAAVGTHWIH